MNEQVKDLISPAELSDMLAIPVATLNDWRYRRIGPTYFKIGRHIRYSRRVVTRWLERQTRETAAR